MNAIARLPSEAPKPAVRQHQPRKVERSPHHRRISIASASGKTANAAIQDASSHGCRVDSKASWLHVGGIISIRFGKETKVMGIVRWQRDGSAGIEFLHPVQPGQSAWHSLFDTL